ncbi:hypothetical protein ANO11243_094520 [Dothideomycetidae sp. 11243]|nr:hypothetical protein ANO11243_094520 [fungal sp. No.11243]
MNSCQAQEQEVVASTDTELSWEGWILEETSVVYQMLNMVFVFEPALLCDQHRESLLLAPLPAERSLWDAGNAQVWNAARDQAPSRRATFGMTTKGELVTIRKTDARYRVTSESLHSSLGPKIRGPDKANEWGEWSSNTDSLGMLVRLAAASVRQM